MKQKIALAVICIETALICFLIFGFVLKFTHINSKFRPMPRHEFCSEAVYDIFEMDTEQKNRYDSLVTEFKKTQRENQKKYFENFHKLNDFITDKNSDKEEINKIKQIQCEIMSDNFSMSVDYLIELKNLLNDEQKEIFADIMKHRHMYKIMPSFEFSQRKNYRKNNHSEKMNFPGKNEKFRPHEFHDENMPKEKHHHHNL